MAFSDVVMLNGTVRMTFTCFGKCHSMPSVVLNAIVLEILYKSMPNYVVLGGDWHSILRILHSLSIDVKIGGDCISSSLLLRSQPVPFLLVNQCCVQGF